MEEDEIEFTLNRQIDNALDHLNYDNGPEQSADLEIDEETLELISRTATDIQQVVGLLRPKPYGLDSKILSVSPEVTKTATQLLIAQIKSLQNFVGNLK
jgi:hypothetical protein